MNTKTITSIHIRWMIRRDMPEVMEIERLSTAYPRTEDDFFRCLRQRNCIAMVAEHREKIVGFMIYELHKARLHIIDFAVHPEWRRTGVGSQMIAKLVSKLFSHRRKLITVAVRETNLAAQLFFRDHDFIATMVIRNKFEDTDEDAFWMRYFFEDGKA